jgi:class 3 adenylate cyclase/pimeloyl-ACP methyl ester carboxylesterase
VRYARNGEVRLAYRIFGESGPVVVWTPGWVVGNVDNIDDPAGPYAPFLDRVSRDLQFVMWDRRGTGLSDPSTHLLSLDERVADLRAVLNAIGDERPSLIGTAEGGPVSILYTATYPDGVSSLALYGTAARFSQELPDFPWGFTSAEIASQLHDIENHWGEGALIELFHGAATDSPGVRELFGKLQRSMMSPSMAKLWWRATMEVDVRAVLGTVRVPTLVLARRGDGLVPIQSGTALAAAIPEAQFHELPLGDHNAWDIIHDLAEHMLRFFIDKLDVPVEERLLKTMMFTDIVNSTEQLSATGDAHWRHQLDAHDNVVDWLLEKYGGQRAKHTGDGIFALFDGPTKAVRCALDLVPTLAARGIAIRAGVHTGECERRGEEWSGIAVHTGARIGALAEPAEVLASRTVRDLSAGSGLTFESLGPQRLKGLPEQVEVYRVTTPTALTP